MHESTDGCAPGIRLRGGDRLWGVLSTLRTEKTRYVGDPGLREGVDLVSPRDTTAGVDVVPHGTTVKILGFLR